MSSRRNGFVMLAASGLAFVLVAMAPGSAFAADACTHGRSESLGVGGTRYTYRSGSWQYIGSQLMHVHQVLRESLLRVSVFPRVVVVTSSTTQTVYCTQ